MSRHSLVHACDTGSAELPVGARAATAAVTTEVA